MQSNPDPLRERLLGRLTESGDVSRYREGISRMLAQNDTRIRRERLAVTLFWIFCAVSATMWMWFDPSSGNVPKAPFLACLFFIWGGVEIVKHYVNFCRIDLLKEIKQLQLQVFELEKSVRQPPGPPA